MATKSRNPVLAALASATLPGLGQLYNGQPLLAATAALIYVAGSMFYTVRLFGALASGGPEQAIRQAIPALAILMLAWLVGVVQAVFGALNRPDYELKGYNRGLLYLGLYALAYVGLPLLAGGPWLNWALARNGIDTPEARAEWLARFGAMQRGEAAPPLALDPGPVPAGTGEPLELRDPDTEFADAPTAIHLALVGGQDGGIYDVASQQPTCTHRTGASPGWSNLYANPADPLGVTAVQVSIPVESGESGDFQLSVNVGNLPDGRSYQVDTRQPAPDGPRHSASVERRGGGAVLRLVGTTPQGVRIEATVQCRQVVEE